MLIEIREKNKGCTDYYKIVLEVPQLAVLFRQWLESDHENLKERDQGTLPTREEIDVPVNEMLIVELYSK